MRFPPATRLGVALRERGLKHEVAAVIEPALSDAVEAVGPTLACRTLGVPSSSYYHQRQMEGPKENVDKDEAKSETARRIPPWTLSVWQQLIVLAVLCSEEFCESAPAQVFYTLLDRGVYLCSISTMYRILRSADLVKDRRPQRSYPSESRKKPQLKATKPNEVWTWDITMLHGPPREVWRLYVIMDIFSRKVVGWRLEPVEDAVLAAELIEKTCAAEGIDSGQLTVHADRGAAMTSQSVYDLFRYLGVAGSHSRPRTSNDNPYSEAGFKTLKYCPAYPGRFATIDDARLWCVAFFSWYNEAHCHSGIGYYTAASVHDDSATTIRDLRQDVLDQAYAVAPARFRHRTPEATKLPRVAWINDPKEKISNRS